MFLIIHYECTLIVFQYRSKWRRHILFRSCQYRSKRISFIINLEMTTSCSFLARFGRHFQGLCNSFKTRCWSNLIRFGQKLSTWSPFNFLTFKSLWNTQFWSDSNEIRWEASFPRVARTLRISFQSVKKWASYVHLTSLPLNLCETRNFDPIRMKFGEKRVFHELHALCEFHSNRSRNEPAMVITRFLRKNPVIWAALEQ